MRVLVLSCLLAVAASGCVAPESLATTQDCPGHWHAAVTFFVHDERVLFTPNRAYTLEGGVMPIRTHMHQGSESVWHFEPAQTECVPLGEALATVDVRLEPGYLGLTGDYHAAQEWGGEHLALDGDLIQAWVRPHGGAWTDASVSDLAASQVPDGAQVLVAFGRPDADDVARMQAEAVQVPSNLRPRS